MARGTKTISQRIALEGGKAIQDDLKKLGAAGEKAFKDIQDAADATQGPSASFGRAMQKLRGELDKVRKAGQQMRDEVGRLGGALGNLGSASATVAKRVGLITGAVAGVAGGLAVLVNSSGEVAEEINNLSQVANATPAAFQKFAFAARTVGIEQDKLADILKDTNDKFGDFLTTGGGPLKDFFEKIAPQVGVTAQQFAKLSGPEALQLYVRSLEKANLGQQEMTFYLEALASDSTLLLPLLRDNGAALQSLGKDAERFGAVLSAGAIKSLTAARASLRETGTAFMSLKRNIAAVFAPFVTATSDVLGDFLAENNRAVTELARDFALRLVPVVQDVLNLLTGNDAAVQNLWVLQARDAVLGFARSVSAAINGIIIPAYQAIVGVADQVAAGINRLFGTNFDGKTLLAAAAVAKLLGIFGLLSATLGVVSASVRVVLSGFRLFAPLAGLVTSAFASLFRGVASLVPGVGGAFAGLFTSVSLGARRMLALVLGDVGKAARGIGLAFSAVGRGIATAATGIVSGFSAAFAAVTAGAGRLLTGIGSAVLRAGAVIASGFGSLVGGVGLAVRGVLTALAGLVSWPALLVAAIAAAAAAIYVYWDEIAAGAQALWARIAPVLQAGVESVAGFAQAAADRAVAAFETSRARFEEFWAAIIAAGEGAADAVARAWEAAVPILGALWDIVVERATRAFEDVSRLFGEGFDALWAGIQSAAEVVWTFIAAGFRGLGEDIVSIFDGVVTRIQSIANRIKSAAAAVKDAAAGLFGGGDNSANALNFATGGHVRGPGTATSDSIPARLSDGEFVQRTRAVQYYGVDFMAALNRMRIRRDDLFAALRGGRQKYATGGLVERVRRSAAPIQRFAQGGLVRMGPQISLDPAAMFGAITTGIMPPVQRFAEGGIAQAPQPGGRPLVLDFGGERVEGVTATPDAADQLMRLASKRRVTSTGGKPGWYGGGR